MDKNTGNALKRARLAQGITQERLAEMSGYSVDSIAAWEGGGRTASVPVLELLSVCLGAPWLTGVYLREQAGGALDGVIPEFSPNLGLSQAACELISKIYAFADKHHDRTLIALAADNQITEQERPYYDEIVADLRELQKAILAVRFSQSNTKPDNKTPPAGPEV